MQSPASTQYSTRTWNLFCYSNSTRTKHYSDQVVSSINSGNFRIISTIIQKQPAMEKIFQDNYSKSWYSKVVVYGKDEQWFACWKEEACWLWDVFEEEKLHKFTIVSSPCSSATPSWSGRWPRPDPCLSKDKVWMSTKYEEEVYLL